MAATQILTLNNYALDSDKICSARRNKHLYNYCQLVRIPILYSFQSGLMALQLQQQ